MNAGFHARARDAAALALAGLLLAIAGALPARAQTSVDASSLSPRRSNFQPWFFYRSLKLTDSAGNETKLTQAAAPVSLNLRLGTGLSALFYGAFASTSEEPPGFDKVSFSGLTDVRAKLFYSGMEGTVFSLGVSLPTGKHALTTQEEPVADFAALDPLGFRVRRFGEGFNLEGGITRAFEAGENGAFALGVGYLAKGEYEYREGLASKYKPGSELSGSAGYDYRTPKTLLRVNAAFRTFTKDEAGGVKSFQQGSQVVLEERWVATGDNLSNDLALHQLLKGQSKTFGAGTDTPASQLSNGSSFGVAERLEFEGSSGLRLAALADADFYGKSEGQYDSANLLGVGGEIGYAPSSRSMLRFQGRVLTGKIKPRDIKISGFEGGASVRVAF